MTSSLYILTAVLDPRFKQLPFLNDEKRDEAYSEVVKLAQRLSLLGESAEQTGEDPLAKKQKTAKEKEIAMLLCGHGAEDDPDEPSAQRSSCDEMKDYLQDRSKVDTAGPLAWWKNNKERYPRLARAAKRLLCIPATSTPAERIFSKAGFIVNKSRSCLLPKNVDM